MSSFIDQRAVIEDGATIGNDVTIGPFAVIGAGARIGDGCRIAPHAVIIGNTTIGARTRIHTGANIGDEPQDLHYTGANSFTDIGEDCIIREYVTIHRGVEEGSHTVVGNRVLLMAFSHLGHNCQIADDVVVANASLLAGRVEVGCHAFISAQVMIHQFTRVGALAMIGGGNAITQDVPPFSMLQERVIQGINAVGLRRAGWDTQARDAIKEAIRLTCFCGLSRPNAIAAIRQTVPQLPQVLQFVQFLENTRRGITSGRTAAPAAREGGNAASPQA